MRSGQLSQDEVIHTSAAGTHARTPALVIASSSFLVTFDITAVVTAMPLIKAEMALTVSGFAWVMDAYSLAFTVLLAAAGVLADSYGRRRALLAGNLVFALASLACGLAAEAAVLWAARAAQGVGAAFVICGGLSLLSQQYRDPKTRVAAFALAGTVSGAAMALGPGLGGLIADQLGWRWIFFFNLPLCILIAVAIPRVAHESRDPGRRPLDLAGLVTLSLALASFVWLLLHGPRVGNLQLAPGLAVAVVVASFAAFVLSQRTQRQPMIDMSVFGSRAFAGMCLVPLALSVAYWAVLVYLPLFLQAGLSRSAGQVSLLMLVPTLPMVLLPLLGGRIAQRMPTHRFFPLGLAVVSLGALGLAVAAARASLPLAVAGMLLSGCGTALVNAQVSGAIVGLVPPDRAGTASAVATMLRQGGFAAGIALLGALLHQHGEDLHPGWFAWPFGAAAGLSALAAACVPWLLRPPPARR